ncbi:MAG: hypothetical protein EAZ06_00110 [Cytophagales bacterium]|nr:MAG: hypothetical protein EAZ06_00110 [Cytophagales bacterium]
MKHTLLLSNIYFYTFAYIFAQNIGYIHLSSKNGLSGDLVNCLWQDKTGLMWIGTNNGLNLYDGYHFTLFKTYPSLDITSLKEDESQNLWIGTRKGLSKLSLKDYTITNIQTPDSQPDLSQEIFVLFADSQKGIWVISGAKRIYRYDITLKTWQYITSIPAKLRAISQIYEKKNSQEIHILVEREEKYIYHLPTANLSTFPFASRAVVNKENKKEIELYYQFEQPADATGEAFDIQTNYEVDVFIGKDTLIKKFKGSSLLASVITYYQDKLWFSTKIGLTQYDLQQKKIIHSYSIGENPILKGYVFGDFLMDRSGALWVATNGNGILIYPPQKLGEMALLRNLRGRSVRSTLIDDNGNIWASAYTTKENFGLSILDKITQKEKKFISLPQITLSMNVDGIATDKYLWIGMQKYGGIVRINQKTFEIEKKWNQLPIREIWSIASDKKNGLWLIAYKGQDVQASLVYFDYQREKFTYFSLPKEDFKTLFLDEKQEIWVGSAQGNLYQFNPSTKHFTLVLKIANTSIKAITKDKNKNIWIATLGAGLWRYNTETKNSISFTEKNGLSSNTLYSIQADKQGNIWAGTLKGISRYNPIKQNFSNFKPEDGLQNNEFNTNASYFSVTQNNMIFGGIDGINIFDPDKLNQNDYIPPIVLTDILQMGKPIVWRNQKNLTLPVSEAQMLEFQFSALSYYHSQYNQYQYKIDGLTTNWVDLGTKNTLLLSNLAAGKYTLRIKGSNHHGVWSKEEIYFDIIIVPPFWQTWWFYTLIILLVLSGIVFYFYRRSKEIEKRNILLEKEVKLRTQQISEQTAEIVTQNIALETLNKNKDRFFTIIAHDLRSPLVSFQGISKQISHYLKRNEHEKIENLGKKIDKSAENITNMLNNLLNWALLQKGEFGFNPEMVDLKILIDENIATFQPAIINYNINVTNEVFPQTYIWADKIMLQTIVHNLLSNAIKFTSSEGKINLKNEKNEKGITLICTDTGLGIAPEKLTDIFKIEVRKNSKGLHGEKGNGIGLPLCFEFTKVHQGQLNITSKLGKGTNISLFLPFTTK